MPALQNIPLPFPLNGPPPGFAYDQRSISELSTTTALHDGVNERDSWNGERKCVVCGKGEVRFCQILPESESYTTVRFTRIQFRLEL